MTETLDPETLRATAIAYLDALGAVDASAVLARASLEVLGEAERWRVEGRTLEAHRVLLWLDAADRVLLQRQPEMMDSLRKAVSSAIESPGGALREIVPLQRRIRASSPDRTAPLYRTSASAVALDGATLSETAAAFLDASEMPGLASALRRAEVALEPVGARASRVHVALDAADLSTIRRDVHLEERLREAVETAALGPAHRAADVVLSLRPPTEPPDSPLEGDAETRLVAAAHSSGWAVVAVDRDDRGATLACAREGRVVLVRIDSQSRTWHEERTRVTRVTVPAADLADQDGAVLAFARIVAG